MGSKIVAGVAALAFTTVLVITGLASAQNWQGSRGNVSADPAGLAAADAGGSASATETSPSWAMGYYYDGYYPGYAHVPGYSYAPLYGPYGAYDRGPRSYRGGLRAR
jgi:hypothetical protein